MTIEVVEVTEIVTVTGEKEVTIVSVGIQGPPGPAGTLDDIDEGTTNKHFTTTDKNKLDGISAGATVNDTDANLRDRSTHTGTQTASTISDFNSSVDGRITAQKGAANGIAPLGSDSKISTSYLPAAVLGGVNYQGTWNASTNNPTLTSGVGTKGYYYKVNTAGSSNLDGIQDWKVGDWAVYNGNSWEKVDNTENIISVNGMTGVVTITSISGNSATATTLETPRQINGVNFDGSEDITIAVEKVNGIKVTVSDSSPTSPELNDLWVDIS